MAIFLPDDEIEDTEDLSDSEHTAVPAMMREPRPSIPPFRCRVSEAAETIRVSERFLTYRIDNGELPTVRDGSARFVLMSELIKYAKKDRPIPPPKKTRKRRLLPK
jgi:hypothetical protein